MKSISRLTLVVATPLLFLAAAPLMAQQKTAPKSAPQAALAQVDPLQTHWLDLSRQFSTHPPVEERIGGDWHQESGVKICR